MIFPSINWKRKPFSLFSYSAAASSSVKGFSPDTWIHFFKKLAGKSNFVFSITLSVTAFNNCWSDCWENCLSASSLIFSLTSSKDLAFPSPKSLSKSSWLSSAKIRSLTSEIVKLTSTSMSSFRFWSIPRSVSYTHLTLPTNREV